jgi:hypothetical protein
MDARTKHILDRITASLPKYLSDNLMMRDPNDVAFDGINDELLKSKHLDDKAKKAIQYASRSMNKKNELVVNPAIARQIEEYYEREIGKAIQNGDLPKPEKDRFMHDRMEGIRRHQK